MVSECKSEYDSGLSKEEERDIKEAIIANEENYDTHIFIPRLTKEQRFEIMSDFIDSNTDYKEKLLKNRDFLVESTKNYGAEFYKKGIKPGVEMEYLTNEIDDKNFKSKWTKFYRDKTKTIAIEWFEKEKNVLQQGV
ncbi:hypothetical protein [uncultured Draconibacterium sp.]|uniref:hypothetical protein n=1 Tax=uncultured Draconibacterium sp. TaxID=1573823 RepID=UPI0029C6C759|nr:hypothetical protein [uncultured Draconibacterium sp.]